MFSKKSISSFLLLVGFPLLALCYSFSSMDPVHIPRYTFTAVYLLLLVLASFFLIQKERWILAFDFLKSWTGIALLLFLLTAIPSTIIAWNSFEAIFFWSKDLLMFGLMLVWLVFLNQNDSSIQYLLKGILLAILVTLLFGFYQLYHLWWSGSLEGRGWYNLSSTLAHRNLFASLLLISLPFSLYAAKAYKRFWKYLAFGLSITSVVLVVLLQARSSWLGLAAFTLAFILLGWFQKRGIKPAKWINRSTVSVFIVSSMFGFSYSWFSGSDELKGQELKFDIKVENNSDKTFTIHERGLMWTGTSRMIKDNSLLGVGPGNWKIHFPKYGSDIWRARQGKVQFQRPHNDYLWILSEQGIMGIISFLLFVLGIFYFGFKILEKPNLESSTLLFIKLLLAGILGYLVVAFFSFPRERMFHQWMVYAAFSIIISVYFKNSDTSSPPRWRMTILQFLILIVSTASIYMGLQRWKGEVLTKQILESNTLAQWIKMKQLCANLENHPFYQLDPTSVPISFYEGLAELAMDRENAALEAFEKAYTVHPNNIHVVNNLATLHQVLNRPDEAVRYYEQALSISPKFLDGALNLSAVLFNNNEVGEAHKVLLEHYSDFPDDDERYKAYTLTILKVLQQNIAEGIQDSLLSKAVLEINEEWLWQIHQKVSIDSSEVERKIIEDAIFGLDSLTHQISLEEAENFRNLYLNN